MAQAVEMTQACLEMVALLAQAGAVVSCFVL